MTLTNLDFISPGAHWPPEDEMRRLNIYARNDLLFDGHHDRVFTDLNPRAVKRISMKLNWFKRATTLVADLLVGETPRVTAEEEATINRLVTDNSLQLTVYAAACDISRYGTAVLKIRFDERGIISRIPPAVWFPVVSPDDADEVTAHVLAWEVGKHYLRVEVHYRGRIEHKLFLLKDGKIDRQVSLATITRYAHLEPEVDTGVSGFLVIPIHNIKGSDYYGLDDYSDMIDPVREIEKRLARNSSILDKHEEPDMIIPAGTAEIDPLTGEAVFVGGGRYIEVDEGQAKPEYLVWDAQMIASFGQVDALLYQLCLISEISPAALGDIKHGIAESGSALKRLMLATLAKVNRIRLRVDPAIKNALQTTAALEVASRMPGATSLTGLAIEWADGLPADDLELASVEKVKREAGITSRRSSIARLMDGATDEVVDAELDRILDDEDMVTREILSGAYGRRD